MKICKSCKEFLDLFNKMFVPEKYWYFEPNKYMSKFDTIKYCKSNFLDNDNKVKSCLIYYSETLVQCIHQPERSKREDLFCCENSQNLIDKLNLYDKKLQEYKMRCSEHCGNTVRDK